MIRLLTSFLLLLALAGPATAHTRSQSISHWRIEGDTLSGRIEADAVDVTRLYALGGDAPLEATFLDYAPRRIAAAAGGECAPQGEPALTPAASGRVAVRLAFRCAPGALSKGVSLRSTLFLDVAATHLHFATLTGPDGAAAEAVLTDSRREVTLIPSLTPDVEGIWRTFVRYVPIGAVHVWGGLDHIAFILALTLLARGLWPLAMAATGFTLGHTATLALAALGVLAPHAATVEALIGFTVAFVALEAGGGGPERLTRWSVALAGGLLIMAALALMGMLAIGAFSLAGLALFAYAYPRGFPRSAAAAPWLAAAFGLVHGCGFAGALGELDLPRPRLLSALGGFNVGVELAQVTVIAAALATAFLWRRLAGARPTWAPELVAAGLFGLGGYWFVSRALGA
jgi:hypothetical protein